MQEKLLLRVRMVNAAGKVLKIGEHRCERGGRYAAIRTLAVLEAKEKDTQSAILPPQLTNYGVGFEIRRCPVPERLTVQ
jgi:hypothetical protein